MSRWLCCLYMLGACAEDARQAGRSDASPEAKFEGCPDTIAPFDLGISTTNSDGTSAVLLGASRVPPARFLNDWTVKLTNAEKQPITDAAIGKARAFMPVHGHYGLPDPSLERHLDDPAVFDIDALNLFMRGPWQIKLDVSTPEAGDAELIFEVCVAE